MKENLKEHKLGRLRSWGLSFNYGIGHPSRGLAKRLGLCKVICIMVIGLVTLILLVSSGTFSGHPAPSAEESLDGMQTYQKARPARRRTLISQRNTSFHFSPRIAKWDKQRSNWLLANPLVRERRPKVLLVSGSQPEPCERSIDTHMFIKAAKNKIHYTRLHDIQMHYNLLEPDSEFSGSWAKLSVLRMLMLSHPEVTWFWWVDSETVFTDMDFELPLKKYDEYNFVIYGDENSVHKVRDRNGMLTANFLIRNCEWSLGLLDAWGSMGPSWGRQTVGKFLYDALEGYADGSDADEQSALVYLLNVEKNVWGPKLFLEKEFPFTGIWLEVTDKLEVMTTNATDHKQVDKRVPLVTYFAGCSQCGGRRGDWPWERCETEMQRALDFADNQIYVTYGYKLRALGTPELVQIPGHVIQPVIPSPDGEPLGAFRGFPLRHLPGPQVTDWDEQRDIWKEKHPTFRTGTESGQPRVMMVTGSSYKECHHPVGSQMFLKALKNKVDYARFHDIELYYDGMVDFDPELTGWWTKIPTIRLLMLTRPDIEWFWWIDADAVITDMVFEFPFQRYHGQNLILYGNYELVEKRDWIAVNAGIYLVRNCQWTLDFFTMWASLGATNVLHEAGTMASKMLPGREWTLSDDQSTLIIILMTDTQKWWYNQVTLERNFVMSGFWKVLTPQFEEMEMASHPGLGTMEWPWITHFAGCQPCGRIEAHFDQAECLHQMQRSFDFSDNQVLDQYGYQHSPLGSYNVVNLRA